MISTRRELDAAIADFNSKYHIDGSGYLRNNDDGYVTAADALKQLDEINRSIDAYQKAVQLFQNIYNPTVEAVTKNFPQPADPAEHEVRGSDRSRRTRRSRRRSQRARRRHLPVQAGGGAGIKPFDQSALGQAETPTNRPTSKNTSRSTKSPRIKTIPRPTRPRTPSTA